MSTLSNILSDMLSLFTPSECVGCGKVLVNRLDWICVECQSMMPLTGFHTDSDNPMAQRIRALNPMVVSATAQYYYINNGRWREVIHEIKYRKGWRTAQKLGYWYGSELAEEPLYRDVDLVIGVPLHPLRLLRRGYNQSEKIAEGMAKALGSHTKRGLLRRVRNNPSQVTTHSNAQRWENVHSLFEVRRPRELEGRHILLVDDVFTTGATLSSCIEAIQSRVPSCRISVATIAISRRNIDVVR